MNVDDSVNYLDSFFVFFGGGLVSVLQRGPKTTTQPVTTLTINTLKTQRMKIVKVTFNTTKGGNFYCNE